MFKYVAIEGGEGIGKSTLLEALKEKFKDAQFIKEPGQTIAGKILRATVLSSELPLWQQMDYFRADRILTQELIVRPAVGLGQLVISDRSLLSNLVYQGQMHGKDELNRLYDMHELLQNFFRPTLTIVGQVPVEIALERVAKRKNTQDNNWLDEKGVEWHRRIHEYFNSSAEWYDRTVVYVNFNRPVDEIVEEVVSIINERFTPQA